MRESDAYSDCTLVPRYEVLKYLSWADFRLALEVILSQVEDYKKEKSFNFDGVYGLPRGGLIFAVCMSYKMKIPLILNEKDITKNSLVVDDCTNTGKTLNNFYKTHKNKTAVIFHKPKSTFDPDFIFRTTIHTMNYCWENKDERN
jgi:hypoxanthine phosphoribosyltransferase